MRRTMTIALACVLALTGCTGASKDPANGPASTATNSTDAGKGSGDSSQSPQDTPAAPAAPREKADAAFGKAHTFPDGVKVTVSKPKTFMPSATSVNGGEPAFVTFTLTVENATKAPVDPAEVFVTVQSGNGQGGQVLDPKGGIKEPPTKTVPPGKKTTWPLAYGILDPEDITITVLPGINAKPATFSR